MAAVKKSRTPKYSAQRVSPLKPGLRGARNWASAQVRAASHTRRGMARFTAGVLAVLFGLIFIALWIGGFLPQVRHSIHTFKVDRLMAMGFVVEQVDVMGEGRLNESDVRAAINIFEGEYFFGVDLQSAQKRTESLPWVDRAVVRRLWPNRITVQIVETTPYAIWQHKGQLRLVDAKGEVIADYAEAASVPAGLKTYIGADAAKHAEDVESLLRIYPAIWSRTESLVQHRSGRWDIYMQGKQVLRLPNYYPEAALNAAVKLNANSQVFSREISVIDLRVAGRVSLTAMPERAPSDGKA